ncbi:MAG TPA: hypothetical protein PLO37_25780 [Candidatus Hydrogenedentes bacterium]|nr:hypothetical protein [Candidatus Hydrogenedentota bacterium]HPG70267.1 hypothetical protein [Candidatus Hydrogenedentota bacterium]
MRYIAPRVPEEASRRFFTRPRFRNLFGLVPPRTAKMVPGSKAPYVELVWLPFYLITLRVSSPRGPGTISTSVEGYSGSFAIFQMHDNLVEGDVNGEYFPPQLTTEEAVGIARKELLLSIMRRRGQQEKPCIEDTVGLDLFYYPFWVYYIRRRRRFIDILLQDALTGERGGNRNKMGLLNAFVARGNR